LKSARVSSWNRSKKKPSGHNLPLEGTLPVLAEVAIQEEKRPSVSGEPFFRPVAGLSLFDAAVLDDGVVLVAAAEVLVFRQDAGNRHHFTDFWEALAGHD
jgi:hypothetical protein